jgi:general stress protein 26
MEPAMVSLSATREHPKSQLWDEINRIHAGMLGIHGSPHSMQPMAPQVDEKGETIWFFAKLGTDIVNDIQPNATATFCVVGKDHDYHACLNGPVALRRDPEIVERYWSSMVEAWYEGGKNDPELTLIEFRPHSAEIWASTGNVVKLGWEIAKANLNDDETPDVGLRQHVDFAA